MFTKDKDRLMGRRIAPEALNELDLSQVRAGYGLESLPGIKVTASELSQIGFCEAFVVLSGKYPRQASNPKLAERRREGQMAHAQRAASLLGAQR